MNRRGFLGAILAAGVAPAVVKASSLMQVFARKELGGLLVPSFNELWVQANTFNGNTLLTPSMITKEALRILEKNLVFLRKTDAIFDHSLAAQNALIVRWSGST